MVLYSTFSIKKLHEQGESFSTVIDQNEKPMSTISPPTEEHDVTSIETENLSNAESDLPSLDWELDIDPLIEFINNISFVKSK